LKILHHKSKEIKRPKIGKSCPFHLKDIPSRCCPRRRKRRNPFGLRLFLLSGAEEGSSRVKKRIMIPVGKIEGGAKIWGRNAPPLHPFAELCKDKKNRAEQRHERNGRALLLRTPQCLRPFIRRAISLLLFRLLDQPGKVQRTPTRTYRAGPIINDAVKVARDSLLVPSHRLGDME